VSDEQFGAWLQQQADDREQHGLHRELHVRSATVHHVDLAGNDYLGMARDPLVIEAAVTAVRTWGCGATGSRLVTGTTELHRELEEALADFSGAGAALVFATGYAANLAVTTALADSDTLIVSDAGNHASLIDGCRLSRGTVVVTPHRDPAAVDRALASRAQKRALVVTDGVFSVDGEAAPVSMLYDACLRHGATLIVDEAHSLGVVGDGGRGVVAQAGLHRRPDIIRTVTLSKALGAQGGAVLAPADVVAHLVDTARTFIFDTGLAPASAGAALQALRLLVARPELAAMARRNASALAQALGLASPDASIVALPLADPAAALAAARRCAERGVRVGCFRPPSVPDGFSRLRMSAHAGLREADITLAADVIGSAVGQSV
jgi:8-amino-7-oxononanoate synthase